MIPVSYYLTVGAILFCLGLIGFLTRRNMIVLFLCAELMLQGVALNFVAFSRHHGNMHGQVFVLFILTVAACEAGLALALILMLYRQKKSLDISLWQSLKEAEVAPIRDTEPFPDQEPAPVYPKLAPAGVEPKRDEEVIRV
ncbi:NADH-quinone oxidoreductase subunit NuoK [Telmatocola sphagniphila]|jgi:NADH-quinone oxidoreductase subunit K|uniref:NADH-quinone oxidoreductase subunit K n=1 Tax=Telmatocola sphagniphila TaxID=1123043 RepID=A0A8E6B4Z7_9BACT|nr:NADH-quinone oxidoreductase subunit NuoK [Telmatocola sphagniphila]QVL31544.1 NADH-quinone oxidoreductase subunit NuoK [Telmatocola sphagniphila]